MENDLNINIRERLIMGLSSLLEQSEKLLLNIKTLTLLDKKDITVYPDGVMITHTIPEYEDRKQITVTVEYMLDTVLYNISIIINEKDGHSQAISIKNSEKEFNGIYKTLTSIIHYEYERSDDEKSLMLVNMLLPRLC